MTPDQIVWPPPVCTACKGTPDEPPDHDQCRRDLWCECDCPWLYDLETS